MMLYARYSLEDVKGLRFTEYLALKTWQRVEGRMATSNWRPDGRKQGRDQRENNTTTATVGGSKQQHTSSSFTEWEYS